MGTFLDVQWSQASKGHLGLPSRHREVQSMKTPGRARGEVRAVWRTEREESTLLRDEADDKAYCPDIARESGLYTFRQSHNQEEGPIGRANIHDPERLVGESGMPSKARISQCIILGCRAHDPGAWKTQLTDNKRGCKQRAKSRGWGYDRILREYLG